jgi:hypothetical protein
MRTDDSRYFAEVNAAEEAETLERSALIGEALSLVTSEHSNESAETMFYEMVRDNGGEWPSAADLADSLDK